MCSLSSPLSFASQMPVAIGSGRPVRQPLPGSPLPVRPNRVFVPYRMGRACVVADAVRPEEDTVRRPQPSVPGAPCRTWGLDGNRRARICRSDHPSRRGPGGYQRRSIAGRQRPSRGRYRRAPLVVLRFRARQGGFRQSVRSGGGRGQLATAAVSNPHLTAQTTPYLIADSGGLQPTRHEMF